MKILVVCPRLPSPPNDGGAIYIFNFIKQLHSLGYKITLVSFYSNLHEQNPALLKDYCEQIIYEKINFKEYGIWSIISSFFLLKPMQVIHRMDKNMMKTLIDRIPSSDFDFIFFEGIHISSLLSGFKEKFKQSIFISRCANVEHILLKRISFQEKNLFKKILFLHQAYLMKIFEKKTLKQFDLFTTISKHDDKILSSYCEETPSFVIKPIINIPIIENIPTKKESILFFGDWKWTPNSQGLEWFLKEVWPSLNNNFPESTITIVGKGLSKVITQLFSKYSNVEYLGFVKDLDTLKSNSSICCAPIFSGSGVKIKVLESLAAGLPLITTDFGTEGIEIETDIHFLKANKSEEFIHQITRVFKSPELQSKLSISGKKFIIEEYSFKKEAFNIDSILRKHLSSKRNINA